ncbi:hypothetical protein GZH49_12830 [Nocardia terpenica]|uniref:hypothetical protein n=1 Tax=Nocardia terpenica TaxID=455432 RepID=UPI002FE35030
MGERAKIFEFDGGVVELEPAEDETGSDSAPGIWIELFTPRSDTAAHSGDWSDMEAADRTATEAS